jgi:hypothetical protein
MMRARLGHFKEIDMSNTQQLREALDKVVSAISSFTKSDYIKKQHPKRYAAAMSAIADANAALSHPAHVVDERAAFEAWAISIGYHAERDMFQRDKYQSSITWELWRVWQARALLAAQPVSAPAEQAGPVEIQSVLIDGVAYDIPAPVAAEMLRMHIDLQAQPAREPMTEAQALAIARDSNDCREAIRRTEEFHLIGITASKEGGE